MQNFCNKWGIKRRLNIQEMQEREAEDYYDQCFSLPKEEKRRKKRELQDRIRQEKGKTEVSGWILAIKDKSSKLVGKIEIFDMGNKKAYLSIEIPNESWTIRYGTEAIDQCIKICFKQKVFEEIELDSKNTIIESYKKQHEIKDEEHVIKIA